MQNILLTLPDDMFREIQIIADKKHAEINTTIFNLLNSKLEEIEKNEKI